MLERSQEVTVIQNWGQGPYSNQAINPFSTLASAPYAVQLLQLVPQQLQQLQQLEYVRQQQLQQIQHTVQYLAHQLQYIAHQQQPQAPFSGIGAQGFGQPFQSVGAGFPSSFSTPPVHVM
jgi:hypothetical protein